HESHAEKKQRYARKQTDGFQKAHELTLPSSKPLFRVCFSIIREYACSVKLKMKSGRPNI
ncbi:MAG: hypothetical protein ABTA22_10410, partial [Clostridia bacterium]